MSYSGSSLNEARELYQLLTECTALIDQVETKSQRTTTSLTKILVVANTLLGVLRRLNLGEDAEIVAMKAQRLIQLFITMRTTANAAYLTMGPLGWVMMGVGTLGLALTAEDVVATVFS